MKIFGFHLERWIYLSLSIVIACSFTACSGISSRSATSGQGDGFFKPPVSTSAIKDVLSGASTITTSTPAATHELIPTTTPSCSNNLLFIEDLTIPDGTLVTPGASIEKQWKVENNGTCNWDERYRVKLIAGVEMGAKVDQALYPARSGTQSTIRIVFTAPDEIGNYRSAWQAFSPEDLPFGDPFFIEIVVENP